jgi:WD40 repeat protein
VSFSPNGQWVVTASWDHTARVWDARTGRPISPPLQHQESLTSARFNRDGNRVVTASYDKTARVWDAKTGRPLSSPLQHQDTVYSPSFSQDGTRVLTASADHTARVWDIAPETASPDWLPDVLEAASFQSLDDSGGLRPFWTEKYFQIRRERLASTSNDPWDVFGRWLFSDPTTRTISPWSPVTIPEYTQRLIVEGTPEALDQAQALSYGHPNVEAQIAAKRASLPPSTPPPSTAD